MKIKLTTKSNVSPKIEIDGVNIIGMDYSQRLEKLSQIMIKIPEFSNWFEELLFSICTQWGNCKESSEEDVYEVEI